MYEPQHPADSQWSYGTQPAIYPGYYLPNHAGIQSNQQPAYTTPAPQSNQQPAYTTPAPQSNQQPAYTTPAAQSNQQPAYTTPAAQLTTLYPPSHTYQQKPQVVANNPSDVDILAATYVKPEPELEVSDSSVPRIVKTTTLKSGYASDDSIKPPYSYAALICIAINSMPQKQATMREILAYIERNFAYYRTHKKWHGTIRHDLTVNDCFMKLPPRPKQKGCLWTINAEFQDMFDNGSLRRRRYRFKEGSAKWVKARKESSAKRTNLKANQTPSSVNHQSSTHPAVAATPTPHIQIQPMTPPTGPQVSQGVPTCVASASLSYTLASTRDVTEYTSDSAVPQLQYTTPAPDGATSAYTYNSTVTTVSPSVSPLSSSSGYNSGLPSPLDMSQYLSHTWNVADFTSLVKSEPFPV